jgi:hypothetical protein
MVNPVRFTDFTKLCLTCEQTLASNEVIDDEVTIGDEGNGWDREERDGRIHLTRRE